MSAATETDQSVATRGLWLGVIAFVLAFGAIGYAWRGNLQGLALAPGVGPPQAAASAPGPAQIAAMVQRLADKLQAEPNDPIGWAMLGRAYSVMGEHAKALPAFQKVVDLEPRNAQAWADLADASGMASGQKLDARAQTMVDKALALDPANPKALGLAGTLAFDQGDAAAAARYWQQALAGVEPGSELAAQLKDAVDAARQRAGLAPLVATAATAATAATSASASTSASAAAATTGASVRLRVSLAPALAAQAGPEETVFIFARAAQGAKMPLAIARRQVKDLPLEITLDDSMAMSPAARLSSQPQVIVGARISKSGNPLAQPGDLQGLSAPLAPLAPLTPLTPRTLQSPQAQPVAVQIAEVLR